MFALGFLPFFLGGLVFGACAMSLCAAFASFEVPVNVLVTLPAMAKPGGRRGPLAQRCQAQQLVSASFGTALPSATTGKCVLWHSVAKRNNW